MSLYHYTCNHGREQIGSGEGVLLPAAQQVEGAVPWTGCYVWLTDLAEPIRDALGLTMNLIRCDRTEHRYRVLDEGGVMRWTTLARTLSRACREIELSPGARPMHWFVAAEPIPVIYDPIGGAS